MYSGVEAYAVVRGSLVSMQRNKIRNAIKTTIVITLTCSLSGMLLDTLQEKDLDIASFYISFTYHHHRPNYQEQDHTGFRNNTLKLPFTLRITIIC